MPCPSGVPPEHTTAWHGGLLRTFARVLVSCAVFALVGCSEPPDKERQQAEGALEAARAAGADLYAPAVFQDAQASLKKYDDAVAQRDYRLALNDALEARNLAYEAAKEAGNKKSELRSQTDRLLHDLQTLLDTAGARAPASSGRGGGAASERLRASREAGSQALQKARSRSEKQDYSGAIAVLTPAIASLRSELPESEPAASRRKK